MTKALNFLFDVLEMVTYFVTMSIGFLFVVWLSFSFVAFEFLPIQWDLIWFLIRISIVVGIVVGIMFANDMQKEGEKDWIE